MLNVAPAATRRHAAKTHVLGPTWVATMTGDGELESLRVVGPLGASDVAALHVRAPRGPAERCVIDTVAAPEGALGIAASLAFERWFEHHEPGLTMRWFAAAPLDLLFAHAIARRFAGLAVDLDDAPRAPSGPTPHPALAALRRGGVGAADPASNAELEQALDELGTTLAIEQLLARIDLAIERLWGTSDKISAIPIELGFSSEASFRRVVRDYTGCSPSELRQRRADLAILARLGARTNAMRRRARGAH